MLVLPCTADEFLEIITGLDLVIGAERVENGCSCMDTGGCHTQSSSFRRLLVYWGLPTIVS